jgi:hypothetical protein
MDFMLTFLIDRDSTSEPAFAEMGRFAGELAAAGRLKGGAPLRPEDEGARLRMDGEKPVISAGPFLETNEVIGGFFIIAAESAAEAIEIAKRCPHLLRGVGPVEVREVIPVGPPA